MSAITALVVERDDRIGDGGWLALRRLRLHHLRADGSRSASYGCDAVVRAHGQDAVVVAVWARRADGGVDVLLRAGLRPALTLGRDPAQAPLPEPPPAIMSTELVAGVLEDEDRGEAGLRSRAAAEVAEEAGFVVAPETITLLGAGLLPSPGILVEKFYFAAVEVDPATQGALGGDGSPMEDGAVTRWQRIDDALRACVAGEVCDLKTELGLRRLRDHLSGHLAGAAP
jgi:ADP-ribose pyrophosphatase